MKQKEILAKLTSIKWLYDGKVCQYTRKIPSFVYPFAENREEGFADELKIVIYIEEGSAFEYLNGVFHREISKEEAKEWKKWAKMQKEGAENETE